MANHKSALKRHRQSEKRNARNRSVRTETRTVVAKALKAIKSGKEVKESISQAASALAKAVKKGAIPKRRAARKLSRIQTASNKTA